MERWVGCKFWEWTGKCVVGEKGWGVELNQANTKIKYKIEKIKKEFLYKVHI